MSDKSIEELITALSALPGIGPRSAQRLVFHILAGNRPLGYRVSESLKRILEEIQECKVCRNFTTESICEICSDEERDSQICIVESPMDLMAIERSGGYKGFYFVLHGKLSPMEGIGPDKLYLHLLDSAIERITCTEIILATNLTVEGEVTAHYIGDYLREYNLRMSRIAHGVPAGGELEYVDAGTLARALTGRGNLSTDAQKETAKNVTD